MGHDITAFREGTYQPADPLARRALLENAPDLAAADASVVAYLHAHMDAFSFLAQRGYGWFEQIGASDHDGGVSGTGTTARISVETLRRALKTLRDHDPGLLETDRWSARGRSRSAG